MKELYVFESDVRLRRENNNIVVERGGEIERMLAAESIEAVNLFGNAQVSTQLLKLLARHQVAVHYYSHDGKYLMSLQSYQHQNYEKQVHQFVATSQSPFCLAMAKRILDAKIANQIELLKAYNVHGLVDQQEFDLLAEYRADLKEVRNLSQALGYEGKVARTYFYNLGHLVPSDFKFNRRSKRPPRDPFNALISLGYSILHGYSQGALHKYGLNLGLGVMHKQRRQHASLASDIMEEWRPIIVDDVAMSLLTRQLISRDMFREEEEGVYLSKRGKRIYIKALRERMMEGHYYFNSQVRTGFIHAMNLQVESLMRAFEASDPTLYQVTSLGDAHEHL